NSVKEEVRDRRIVTILRKYLDMEFESAQLSVFNRKDFEALGELLFDLIFNDENLLIEFKDWYKKAIENNAESVTYNIFLEFEQEKEFDDLAVLPWEYIYFKPKEKELKLDEPFLAASTAREINFYRKVPFTFVESHDEEMSEIEPPLKILLIIADPFEKPVKKKKELLKYFSKLTEKYGDEKLQVKYLYQPSPNPVRLKKQLDSGRDHPSDIYSLEKELNGKIGPHDASFSPNIIHFVGHGFVEDNNGMLIFTEESINTGGFFEPRPFSDSRFANSIKDSRLRPKLIFLQVCNGGRIVDYINNTGIIMCLLEKRVPYVIAMQNPIQEDHALRFTQTFYNQFLEGKNIGACVSAGRYELGGYGEFYQKAFGSPVLCTYLDKPLRLKMQEEKKQFRPEKQEELLKFCNTHGCLHYGDKQRYSATDVFCSQGHPLVERQKGAPVEAEVSRSMRPEGAAPKSRRRNIPEDHMHSYSRNVQPDNLMDGVNGQSLRSSSRWSSLLYKIKNEIHNQIEQDIGIALKTLDSCLLPEIYQHQLKGIEDVWSASQKTGNAPASEQEIKDSLHQYTETLKEEDIKPEYLYQK
ncbi:MAG: CHAT domain-containing protein, partial [Prolixibacteraceae bacterium]